MNIRDEIEQIAEDYGIEIDDELTCAISYDLMTEPVHAPGVDNCTYERQFIEKHLRINGFSPFTTNPMTRDQLVPNREIAQKLNDFYDKVDVAFKEHERRKLPRQPSLYCEPQ